MLAIYIYIFLRFVRTDIIECEQFQCIYKRRGKTERKNSPAVDAHAEMLEIGAPVCCVHFEHIHIYHEFSCINSFIFIILQ